MSHHLKPFQLNIIIVSRDARLLFCNGDLVFDGVHSVQIRQQQSPLAAFCYDHTVAFDIQFVRRGDCFRCAEDINAVNQLV